MREKYIGRRKGEMEWGKLSLIKEASKRLFSGGKRREVREKHEVYSHHTPLKEEIKCTLILVMITYLTIQESGG